MVGEHAVHFVADALRVDDTVEGGRDHDGVEGAIRERKVVPVADDVGARTEREAGLDHLNLGAAKELVAGLIALATLTRPADDEHPWAPPRGGSDAEQLDEPAVVSLRDDVAAARGQSNT